MNIYESIRYEIVKHAVAVDAEAPGMQGGLTARGLTGEQIVGVLSGLDADRSEKMHWQTSIVGLMNLLGLNPSSTNLQQLARELGYQGDSTDATALNGWLHHAVMRKLTDRGG